MPAYKDAERMTPEQLAEFILKERKCRNCKRLIFHDGFCECVGSTPVEYINVDDINIFGCNQWEAK